MKIFKALFGKKAEIPPPEGESQPEQPEDILRIARLIGPMIDSVANDIIASHRTELLAQPITYIVPAVWGAVQDGELSELQKEIHQRVLPVVNRIIRTFAFENISRTQEFGLGYVVRGLIISKVTYMIETLRSECIKQDKDILSRLDPVGKA